LQAVEKLEQRGNSEKTDRKGDNALIVGVDAGDETGQEDEREGGAEFENSGNAKSGPAGASGGGRIVRPERSADGHGGGGAYPEGNHIGDGRGVEDHSVGGEAGGVEDSDQGVTRLKDSDFEADGEGGREAQTEEPV